MNPNAAPVVALSQGPEKQLHEPNAPEKGGGAGQEEHLEVPGPQAHSHRVLGGQKPQGSEEMQDQEKHQGQGEKSGQLEPREKEKPEPGQKPGQEKPQEPEEKQKPQWQEAKKQGLEEKPGQEQSQEETSGQEQSQEERPGLTVETGDPEPSKKRLRRTTFTRSQVNELESVFQNTQYPDSVLR